jgi:hypothetical protein
VLPVGRLAPVHNDEQDPDEELVELIADHNADEYSSESEEPDWHAHTLSIRRADGEEVVTILSADVEWSVYLQPGGGITNAFLGTPGDPTVWVDASDRQVERDEDGTYFIRID